MHFWLTSSIVLFLKFIQTITYSLDKNTCKSCSSSSFSYSQNVPLAYSQVTLGKRSFHSSQSRRNELPKSPFQTFVDTLKEELQKNRELQENVKQLQGDVDKFQDSEAMKRARAAYERARVSLTFSNPNGRRCHYIILLLNSISISQT